VVLLGLCLTLFALGQLISVGASGNPAETPSLALAAKPGPQSTITAGALANDAALDNGTFSPTDTPTIINSPAATEELPSATPGIPSATPLATPVKAATATETRAPPSAPLPAKAPGVYVSGIQISPAQPKRNQPVTFVVAFLNNTGTPHAYSWLIQIFDAGTQKRFGDTRVQSLTVPVGTSQSTSANSWHVAGPGGCVSFFAQAQFQNPDGSRVPFPAPNGGVVSQKFSVCP
jgi:hypothetical protein